MTLPPHAGGAAALPVQTITGFLGACKTTLIQRLMASRPAGARVAVVVNEFGKLPFDGAILRADAADPAAGTPGGGAIYDLPGGCICCTQAAQLAEMLDRIAERAPDGSAAFSRVLIEASGAATADGIILNLFAQPPLPNRVPLELAPTVAVVDCDTILTRLTWDIYVLKQQLQVADLVVLNRSADLPEARVREIEAAIREYAPVAPLLPEPAAADAWETVCVPRFGGIDWFPHASLPGVATAPPAARDHGYLHAGMEEIEIDFPAAADLKHLARAIEAWATEPGLGLVLRAKGFVATANGIRALELAGGRVFQRKMGAVEGCATGRLVVIGKKLQRDALAATLIAPRGSSPARI